MVHLAISDTNFRAYVTYKKMASWEPVDVDPIDRDEIADEDDKWDDDFMNDLERIFEELRQFNKKINESRDNDTREESSIL